MTTKDAVIIGAGPAGSTAAIYLARAGYNPLLFGGKTPGGQLVLSNEIENFPGFPEPVAGAELMQRMHAQMKRLGALLAPEEIIAADFSRKPFSLKSSAGEEIAAKTVVLAVGARARWLGLESEKRLVGKGVSACATCDGFFYRGKEVCVVGGGDTALEDAAFVARFASKVTIIHRRDEFRGSHASLQKAKSNPKIAFELSAEVAQITGSEKVTGVKVRGKKTGALKEIPCEGVFIAIGHEPDTALFQGQIELDSEGYIITDGRTHTSLPGIFACGDAADPRYKQAVTAAATGCMAAREVQQYLINGQWILDGGQFRPTKSVDGH